MTSTKKRAPSGQEKISLSFSRSWIIWGCAAFFYCYQFILRVSPGVMADDLMESFQVDAYSLGILTSLYGWAYSSLQIPAGTLMDYFKPRRILTMGAVLAGGGTLLFSSADSLTWACVGRALIGVGSAMGFLSCLKLGTLWFSAHKMPFVIGMTIFLGTMGGAAAGLPLTWLIIHLGGWRPAMWVLAFVGFGLAVLVLFVVRDKPPAALEKAILKSHGDKGADMPQDKILDALREVIRKPQSWLIALYGFCMYVPLAGFADLWGTPFFVDVYHLDKETAAFANSCIYFGMAIASPFAPLLCKVFKAYRPVIFISGLVPLILLSALFYFPVYPPWMVMTLLFVSGAFLSGQFLAFALTCALNPLSASGTASGFHNMLCMLSAITIPSLIGWLLDFFWQGAWSDQVHLFTHFEYSFALTSITFSLLCACMSVFFIKEQY